MKRKLFTAELKAGKFGIERSISDLSKEIIEKYPYPEIASLTELCALINGKNSVLDIKKMLDTQFRRESDLQSIFNYLNLLKMAGLVTF